RDRLPCLRAHGRRPRDRHPRDPSGSLVVRLLIPRDRRRRSGRRRGEDDAGLLRLEGARVEAALGRPAARDRSLRGGPLAIESAATFTGAEPMPLLLFLHLTLASASASPAVAPDTKTRVDAVFHDVDRSDSPGCALGVYHDGEIVYERGYGMANLE